MREFSAEYVPGLDGIPATKSAISYLDGEKGILAYRGHNISDLIKKGVSFEQCAYLLIYGDFPGEQEHQDFRSQLRRRMTLPDEVITQLRAIPRDTPPMIVLSVGVLALSAYYQRQTGVDPQEQNLSIDEARKELDLQSHLFLGGVAAVTTAWEQIRSEVDIIRPREEFGYAQNFSYMLLGEESARDVTSRLIDSCLILHAEHTINASTFAVLVTASTLSDPGFVVSTGVNTLAGSLHGGANERVIKMIDQIKTIDHVKPWLDEVLQNKHIIWGMGHREYQVKDPRATILQELIQGLFAESGRKTHEKFDIALELEALCKERLGPKGVFPNVDFYSGILYRELGIPTDLYTPIFAVARTAGWLAHWMEQIQNNRIFRPTQIYTGTIPK